MRVTPVRNQCSLQLLSYAAHVACLPASSVAGILYSGMLRDELRYGPLGARECIEAYPTSNCAATSVCGELVIQHVYDGEKFVCATKLNGISNQTNVRSTLARAHIATLSYHMHLAAANAFIWYVRR